MTPEERRALIKSRVTDKALPKLSAEEVAAHLARLEAGEIARGRALHERRIAEFEAFRRENAGLTREEFKRKMAAKLAPPTSGPSGA